MFLNESSFVDLLKKLISTRNRAIESIIKEESHDSVKNKLKLCMRILIQTVHLIYSCFIRKYFIHFRITNTKFYFEIFNCM